MEIEDLQKQITSLQERVEQLEDELKTISKFTTDIASLREELLALGSAVKSIPQFVSLAGDPHGFKNAFSGVVQKYGDLKKV